MNPPSNVKVQVVNELYKPARKKFKRRRTVIKGFDDLWQTDLIEIGQHAKENKGFRFILVVIDCFSKFLWLHPLRSKTAKDVSEAMESVLNQGRRPTFIQSDAGKEYFNSTFNKLMKKYNITHYCTFSTKKASMAERVIRTIKEKLHKLFNIRGTYKWTDILQEVVDSYNNTVHRTTKMKPIDVTKEDEPKLLKTVYRRGGSASKKNLLEEGAVVRISKEKALFEKGYTPRWTTELFKIASVRENDIPATYLLEDMSGHPIRGCFYREELQQTKHPDIYLVEKVLRRKGQKLYVKYLGLNKAYNSWLDIKDIQ